MDDTIKFRLSRIDVIGIWVSILVMTWFTGMAAFAVIRDIIDRLIQ